MTVKRGNVVVAIAAAAVLLVVVAMMGGVMPFLWRGGGESPDLTDASDFTLTSSGLRYQTTRKGYGPTPARGQTIEAHYTGWLRGFNKPPAFDSSRVKKSKSEPFAFKLGVGEVIAGWDEAFATMRVGERRRLIIPPNLGYGNQGSGNVIPGKATLFFDVELMVIR